VEEMKRLAVRGPRWATAVAGGGTFREAAGEVDRDNNQTPHHSRFSALVNDGACGDTPRTSEGDVLVERAVVDGSMR